MTNKPRLVLITTRIETDTLEHLSHLFPAVRIEHCRYSINPIVPDAIWEEVEVLYPSYYAPLPDPQQVPQLRWVQLYSAGVNHVIHHPLVQTNVVFTTTSGVHAINMAEHVFTMMFYWPRSQQPGFPSRGPTRNL